MSLSAQILELEDDLHALTNTCNEYEESIRKLDERVDELEKMVDELEVENEELSDFIAFVDETNHELRVAYEAAKALEGEKK